MSDYTNYPQVWKPQHNPELLMVRVPFGTDQLTRQGYKTLLGQRIEWLIQSWMEQSGETQEQTHQKLTQALSLLLSYQEPPRLREQQPTEEFLPLWEWIDEWVETFLDRNEVLMQKLSVDFPVTLKLLQPQATQDWLNEHDAIILTRWLTELTAGMTTDPDF